MRVIKIIRDTEFAPFINIARTGDDTYSLPTKAVKGTVIYVAGIIEEDEDALMCLGAVENSYEYSIAFHKGFKTFEEGWNKLIKECKG